MILNDGQTVKIRKHYPIYIRAPVYIFQKLEMVYLRLNSGKYMVIWLGLSTRFSATFWQLLVFRATFFYSEQFFQLLSSYSVISEQLLVLKLAFLPYFTMFQQTIYEITVKKKPNPQPWSRSWAQDDSSRAARPAVLEKIQNGGRRFTLD